MTAPVKVAEKVDNFQLADQTRLAHELYYFKAAPAIVVMSRKPEHLDAARDAIGGLGGRVLAEIAAAHQATPRQVGLRFLTRHASLFTIPKAASPEHAVENAGAGALQLSAGEIARIEESFALGRRPSTLPML